MHICPECGTLRDNFGTCPRDGHLLVDTSTDPILGTQLGPYRVVSRVGAGGMGQVYKGVHPTIGSRVAIKFLSNEFADDPVLVERFFSEARAVNVIRHESIVNVLDLATSNEGRPYIVMEYLDGMPLSAVLKQSGPLPIGSSVQLVVEVLLALEAAHSRGIVHRDIKPENLFVLPSGRVKLLDFGIAKLRPGVLPVAHETRTGALLGTPQYMSPEQALGREADARADIYSVGIVLYQMVSGRLPFAADSLYEMLKQHVETLPPTPRVYRPEVTAQLEWVLLGALQKAPAQRFQSAAAMADALAPVLAELPPSSFVPLSPSLAGKASRNAIRGHGAAPELHDTTPEVPLGGYPSDAKVPRSGAQDISWGTPASSHRRSHVAMAFVLLTSLSVLVVGGIGWLSISFFQWQKKQQKNPASGAVPSSSANSQHKATSTPTEPGLPPQSLGDARPQSVAVPGFERVSDRHHVVVEEQLKYATSAAKEALGEASLIRLDVFGMHQDGTVDLDVSGETQSSIIIRFRSPSRSERPAGLPEEAVHRADCQFHYLVNEYGKRSNPASNLNCDEPTIPLPRCKPQFVWSRAVTAGAPTGNHIGNLSYLNVEGEGPRWAVSIGSFTQIQTDDCP